MTREEASKAAENYASQMCNNCSAILYCEDKNKKCVERREHEKVFADGIKWADEHPYWRPATEHPVADIEVIALVGKYLKVVFAHIVKDRERVVDYDGWNIPEVKWWMPIQSIGEPEENEW